MDMKILSHIHDGFLDAENIMAELTIGEYLRIAREIVKNNIYQRARVKKVSSIYSLLNNDLKHLCTFPTIVLAVKTEHKINDIYNREKQNINEDVALEFLNPQNIMILDGLQRTYTMLDVEKELKSEDPELLNKYLNHKMRIEFYLGISKTGILYRMLTLNTGQTPMSKRHEIEILYSDYQNEGKIGDVTVYTQKEAERPSVAGEYNFDDLIEGFSSFINSDESPISKDDIVSTAKQIEKVVNDNENKDLFNQFVACYNTLSSHLIEISDDWSFAKVPEQERPRFFYGDSVQSIMAKSQTMTGFGAAIGVLFDESRLSGLVDVTEIIGNIKLGENPMKVWMSLLSCLNDLRRQAKKIGVEQRLFFRLFFKSLFNRDYETYCNVYISIEEANNLFLEWKKNGTKL